jgi:hypothetical protein
MLDAAEVPATGAKEKAQKQGDSNKEKEVDKTEPQPINKPPLSKALPKQKQPHF